MVVLEGMDLLLERPSEISGRPRTIKCRSVFPAGTADKGMADRTLRGIPANGTDSGPLKQRERTDA